MAETRLHRSTTDRKIGGVCGGIAEYFDWDPNAVRIAWIVAALFAGTGFLLYIVLWIVLPEGSGAAGRSSAIAIAEERYARGEITADELQKIKADLGT